MHAYRRFVQTEMDKRGWTAADLQRSSGLTKQNLSRLLRDDREQLQQRPDAATVSSLARAFGVGEELVLTHVAEAMGLPTGRVEVAAAADLSNDELLRILAERLRGGTHEPAPDPEAAVPAPDRDDVADPTVRDGATTGRVDTNLGRAGTGAISDHRQQGHDNEDSARAGFAHPASESATAPGRQPDLGKTHVGGDRAWGQGSADTFGENEAQRPRKADYGRAADDSGPSLLEADDARAAVRGEESQDPEGWR